MLIKKIILDLASTLYDDYEFKYMSMPRVWCAISGLCVVTAWVSEQYYGLKFTGFGQLVTWAGLCIAAYGIKKYAEKEKI
jgi:hypothetical protein